MIHHCCAFISLRFRLTFREISSYLLQHVACKTFSVISCPFMNEQNRCLKYPEPFIIALRAVCIIMDRFFNAELPCPCSAEIETAMMLGERATTTSKPPHSFVFLTKNPLPVIHFSSRFTTSPYKSGICLFPLSPMASGGSILLCVYRLLSYIFVLS